MEKAIIHWNSKLAKLILPRKFIAITFGKQIFIKRMPEEIEELSRERLLRHEKKHSEQYARYGFIGFLIRYLILWIKYGYKDHPLEIEARLAENSSLDHYEA